MKLKRGWLAAAFSVMAAAQLLGGQGQAKGKIIPVTGPLGPRAMVATVSMNLSTSSVHFAASNPLGGSVAGNSPLTASFTLTNTTYYRTWTLTIQAQGANLVGTTGATIAVGAISYTATGSVVSTGGGGTLTINNASGALSTTAVQTASGREGTAPFQGQVVYTFAFTDSWNYIPDTYSQTVVLTVTAP